MKDRKNRARNVFLAALAALILCCVGCMQGEVPQHPCVEHRQPISPAHPCKGLAPAECALRRTYVRAAEASTVGILTTRYDAKTGISYLSGTGTVIDGGTVITAYHVVKDATFIVIDRRHVQDDLKTFISERVIPMKVRAVSKEHDVALITPAVEGETLWSPMPLRSDPMPSMGEPLWHFGRMSGWSYGKVDDINAETDGLTGLTRVDFPCRHGDSGGPLVDMDGRLVGVLVRKDGDDGAGHTFFLPIDVALKELDYRR